MAQNEANQCAQCPESANLVCSGCKGAPDGAQGTVAVWYCTQKCQKDDWKNHKQACKAAKDRQTLYCAGDTAQKMQLVFSRATFSWGIKRIEKCGAEWLMYQPSPEEVPAKSQLQDFPSVIFPKKEDQLAILTYQHCCGALAHLHDFLKMLLNGLYSRIEEVTVWVKNARFRMRQVHNERVVDMTDYKHSFLRVTTKTGEMYALDMTGAQFGWTESVLPWNIFASTRISVIDEIEAFGFSKPYLKEKCLSLGEARTYIHAMDKTFEDVFTGCICGWQKANVALPALLQLPQERFDEQQQALLEHMDHAMQTFRDSSIDTGRFPVLRCTPGAFVPGLLQKAPLKFEKPRT